MICKPQRAAVRAFFITLFSLVFCASLVQAAWVPVNQVSAQSQTLSQAKVSPSALNQTVASEHPPAEPAFELPSPVAAQPNTPSLNLADGALSAAVAESNKAADFAQRFGPILDVFEQHDINFALEVHPTEIAFDIASAERAIAAVGGNKRFGFNYDPSHLAYQGVDYVKFIRQFADRIYNAHMKDVWWGKGDGTVGVFGGHTSFGDARRFWDFRSVGRGMVDFESIIVALNDVGYAGPLSVEWEDSRMDRVHGATESAAFCKRLDFKPAAGAFDAVFAKENQ